MNDPEQKMTLRVAEALPTDVGRGIVRIDPQDAEEIGASIGDIVEITGQRTTVGRVMPAYAAQRGQRLIQMDGIVRHNTGSGLDEQVAVQLVESQSARSVVLSPLDGPRARPGGSQERYLSRQLDSIPVVSGDRVIFREKAVEKDPCDCLCYFPMKGVAGPFSPGTYNVELIDPYGRTILEKEIEIE